MIDYKEVKLNRYSKEKKRIRLEFLNKKKKSIVSDNVKIIDVLRGVVQRSSRRCRMNVVTHFLNLGGVVGEGMKNNTWRIFLCLFVFASIIATNPHFSNAALRAGAAEVDITPTKLPVIINGGFLERKSDQISDPLRARCLILADGKTTVAFVIVDSCMIPRDVCDRIKALASKETGIAVNRIVVAATHTHSAPSLMNYCLGSRRDKSYTEYVIPIIAKCVVKAYSRMKPAEVGWGKTKAPLHTFCRRWILRPDRIGLDPFGKRTVRAMMHPGFKNPDYVGPAGPVDTELCLLSLRTLDGIPICVVTNFSMHYVGGVSGISADYWGHFSRIMTEKIFVSDPTNENRKEFVAMMSQGTSGDLHWMDYSRARQRFTPEKYADELAKIAFLAYRKISYRRDVELAMVESRLKLARRVPNDARLAWAQKLNSQRGNRRPRNRSEVYAEQAVWIDEHPIEEIVLQAIRIGDVGITAIPNEVFGVTGLKLKKRSPLRMTFNMELANGAAGYIPPEEQHRMGGYTTWPARTAGLEIGAESKIVDRLLTMLEKISGQKRRAPAENIYPVSIRANMRRVLKK